VATLPCLNARTIPTQAREHSVCVCVDGGGVGAQMRPKGNGPPRFRTCIVEKDDAYEGREEGRWDAYVVDTVVIIARCQPSLQGANPPFRVPNLPSDWG
jgi:hypothetical protein